MKKLALFALVVLSFSSAFGMTEKKKPNCDKIATLKTKKGIQVDGDVILRSGDSSKKGGKSVD